MQGHSKKHRCPRKEASSKAQASRGQWDWAGQLAAGGSTIYYSRCGFLGCVWTGVYREDSGVEGSSPPVHTGHGGFAGLGRGHSSCQGKAEATPTASIGGEPLTSGATLPRPWGQQHMGQGSNVSCICKLEFSGSRKKEKWSNLFQ